MLVLFLFYTNLVFNFSIFPIIEWSKFFSSLLGPLMINSSSIYAPTYLEISFMVLLLPYLVNRAYTITFTIENLVTRAWLCDLH